jgi:hypothetical protein
VSCSGHLAYILIEIKKMEEKRYSMFTEEEAKEVKERAKALGKQKAKNLAKKFIKQTKKTYPLDEKLDAMEEGKRIGSDELKKFRAIETKREKTFNKLQKALDKKPRMKMHINSYFRPGTGTYDGNYVTDRISTGGYAYENPVIVNGESVGSVSVARPRLLGQKTKRKPYANKGDILWTEIDEEHRGKGYAKEARKQSLKFLRDLGVRTAHSDTIQPATAAMNFKYGASKVLGGKDTANINDLDGSLNKQIEWTIPIRKYLAEMEYEQENKGKPVVKKTTKKALRDVKKKFTTKRPKSGSGLKGVKKR